MKLSREFLIGALVVVAVALLYIGVNFLKGVNLFGKQQRFYAVYENVAGLVPSNAVILNGYKIGIVSKMDMHPSGDGSLIVEVVLNSTDIIIPKDTRLQIYDADLFGGKAIQIIMGDSSVIAVNRDTLTGSVNMGLQETLRREIEPLKQKTSELFAGVDSVLTSMNAVFQSSSTKGLPAVFERLQTTMENLEHASGTFDEMLQTNNQRISAIFSNVESISANLQKNNEPLNRAIRNIGTLSDSLAKLELTATISKVDRAMEKFETVMTSINSGDGTLGQLIHNDSLHNELVSASHSLDLLLDDMRTHPRRYVSFSLLGRKDSEKFSKAELEQMRDEIDGILKEKK
jgi:phospholipid/cholesterol/gamma-HCH transport system substrate-binding protein